MGAREKDVYDDVPDDIFLLVFSRLHVVDLLRCTQASQTSLINHIIRIAADSTDLGLSSLSASHRERYIATIQD